MWYRNVKSAFLGLFDGRGLLAFLIRLDRLGNALSGGSPVTTISGRVGFYAMAKRNPFWKLMQFIINVAFYPVDGYSHCYNAWVDEVNLKHKRGNDVGLVLLSVFIILACILITPVTYGSKVWDGSLGLVKHQR